VTVRHEGSCLCGADRFRIDGEFHRFDGPLDARPDAHLIVASRAAWDHDLASLPTFERLPE
jgi:hypothetical protein